jgi:hypothetical protein
MPDDYQTLIDALSELRQNRSRQRFGARRFHRPVTGLASDRGRVPRVASARPRSSHLGSLHARRFGVLAVATPSRASPTQSPKHVGRALATP